jgi:hypothetical protein
MRRRKNQKKKTEVATMDYDDYVKERDNLSKGEQASFDSYEKTILTLSASFLAFSVGFIGLFKTKTPAGVETLVIVQPGLLVVAWVLFAISVFFMLFNFAVSAQAFRRETDVLGEALEDIKALTDSKNIWSGLGYALYLLSGISFVAGIVFLVIFCARNIQTF